MTERPLEDLVDRLERARLDADRLYNDALTAVDRAVQRAPELPIPPSRYDDERVTPINRAWRILPDAPSPTDRSLKGRLRSFIWRMVGPPFDAQQRFNAELVDHINRNVAAHRDDQAAIVRLIDVVREQFDALVRFESLLVQYLQTITLHVDIEGSAHWRHRARRARCVGRATNSGVEARNRTAADARRKTGIPTRHLPLRRHARRSDLCRLRRPLPRLPARHSRAHGGLRPHLPVGF